jgi:proteasome lid subunit RPN8/RPN11
VSSPLTLGPGVLAVIQAHGGDTYPHECCGALLGLDGVVRQARPLPNTTEEGPRRRFLVRPRDYRSAEAWAAEQGLDLIGFYHSHPDHPARPSEYDLEHAWPVFSYVIISVAAGRPGDITSWRLAEDRSAFAEEQLAY